MLHDFTLERVYSVFRCFFLHVLSPYASITDQAGLPTYIALKSTVIYISLTICLCKTLTIPTWFPFQIFHHIGELHLSPRHKHTVKNAVIWPLLFWELVILLIIDQFCCIISYCNP